jgi:hypothetical protein
LSIVQQEPLELGLRPKIQEQCDLNRSCAQIVQDLCLVVSIQRLQCLQLQQDISIHNQVCAKVSDHFAAKVNWHRNLTQRLQTGLL